MSTYQGDAAVILGNGRELQVAANLHTMRVGLRTTWGGSLRSPRDSTPIELFNLTSGTLRIGDREGAFLRPDISDWTADPTGTFRMIVEGNGDSPF
jgi:hypothetical protein